MGFFKKKSTLSDLSGRSLEELLILAEAAEEPKDRYAILLQAEKADPDNLQVQRKLLLHGRWHERNPAKFDFSVIKCYLLHAFEHPEDHQPQEQQRMTRELFDDERLLRCLELTDNKPQFIREYLEDLAREYMQIFVSGDNRHVPRVFGISFKGSLVKYLAYPAKDIISNIFQSPYLNAEEARMLAQAFYRAFFEHAHGQVGELDKLLGPEIRALLK